jgi:4-amino-4-deoxy-L-arabinose transferase-like glycosyltransferase
MYEEMLSVVLQRARAAGVRPWLLVIALVLPLPVFTVDLGTPSLWDPDEGQHAEVAREMLLTREWLAPQLSYLPYREKPPVYYWVLASALATFGRKNEAAMRLPSAIAGIIGVWAALVWGWRYLRPLTGTLAALILASTGGYIGISRLVFVDAVFGITMATTLLAMGEVLLGGASSFPWAFYLLLGAATLIGGPIAPILVALVACVFVVTVRDPKRLGRLRPLAGSLLLVAMILPLLLLVHLRDPDYLPDFLWRHNVLRYWNPDAAGDHPHSILFFLGTTFLLLLPWGIFLPWSLRDALRSGGEHVPESRMYLLAWLGVFVLFYGFSGTRLPNDMLAAFFPLSLLTARSLTRLLRRPPSEDLTNDPVFMGSAALFLAVLAAPLIGYQVLLSQFPMYVDKVVYLLLLVPLAVAGLTAVAYRNRRGALSWLGACGLGTILGLYHFGSETVSAYNSMEMPADLIAMKLPATAPLVSYRTTSHSLSFYSERPVQIVDDLAAVAPLLNGEAPVALLTKERFLPDVRAELHRFLYIWWEGDSKKLLLANRPPPPGADPRILLPLTARHVEVPRPEAPD